MKLDTLARIHAEQARDTVTRAQVPPLDRIVRRHHVFWLAAPIVWTAVIGSAALIVLLVSGPAIDNASQGAGPETIGSSVPLEPGLDSESGVLAPLPDNTWLNFLFEGCDGCPLDAHWMEPTNLPDWMEPTNLSVGTGTWTAYRPFHVREGFVTKGDAALGEGFDVVLLITRRPCWECGGEPPAGVYPLDETIVETTDYVTRGTTEYCGPGYASQDGPQECEWFVHDFSDGLPPGRYDIRADWHAPCSAWVDLGFVETCADPNEVMNLFNSSVNAPIVNDPSYDSMQVPEPVVIGDGAGVDQTIEEFERGSSGSAETTPRPWTGLSDWPGPLRIEPAGGAATVSMEPLPPGVVSDPQRTFTDGIGDIDEGAPGWLDITTITAGFHPEQVQVYFDLAVDLQVPIPGTVAYGLVADVDGDGTADIRYGMVNISNMQHVQWRTDLATGIAEQALQPDGAIAQTLYPSQHERGTGGILLIDRPLEETKFRFYLWASQMLGSEVIATDYAPDNGWIGPIP